MLATEPFEIECPTCLQRHRFEAAVPREFACRKCRTVMDLRAYATGSPAPSVERRTRPRPARRALPRWLVRWKWFYAGVGALVALFEIAQGVGNLGSEPTEAEVRQRQLDELLHPDFEARKQRDDDLKRQSAEEMRRLMSRGSLPGVGLVLISAPKDGQELTTSPTRVAGQIMLSQPTDVVTVNGVAVPVTDGAFTIDVALNQGANTIEIELKAGDLVDRKKVHVTYRPRK